MKIKPVINTYKPNYPDKYQIDVNRELLYYRPKRWLKNPVISIALAVFMFSGAAAGCTGALAGDPLPPDYNHLSDTDALTLIAEELEKSGYIFENGRDSGSGFAFDGKILDGEKEIDLEYVSKDDLINQKYKGLDYSFDSADSIYRQLKDIYANAAIFFDPYYSTTPEELIRGQVQDFIEWLQSININ